MKAGLNPAFLLSPQNLICEGKTAIQLPPSDLKKPFQSARQNPGGTKQPTLHLELIGQTALESPPGIFFFRE